MKKQEGEKWEFFEDMTGREFVVYNFDTLDGKNFCCTARSVELARNKRNLWIKMGFKEISRMTGSLSLC